MFENDTAEQVIGKYHFRRLLIFRSAVIATEVAAIVLAVHLLGVTLPVRAMLAVIAVHAAFNLLVWMRRETSASALEFFLHLVVDVLALAGLLFFSGGSGNPFVSMFLLPLVIVAATLPKRYVWIMAAVTLACYSLLMVIHMPLSEAGHNMQHHVLGMWFSFLLGVGVILFFVVSMAEALRQRDNKLAEAREKNLRDEHMVALGTMAAGAAHELGTPLGTMAVVTHELEQEYSAQPQLLEQLHILRSQVDRCKTTLSHISASAGQLQAVSGHSENVASFLKQIFRQWQEMHANTTMSLNLSGHDPAPRIVVDETLNQAVINLLNNAADASPKNIEVNAAWSDIELHLNIRDFGEGLSQDVLNEIGKPFFTTKKDGHGLGFYLAQAVVLRLGGDMKISNHPDGGASIVIRLPLNKLMAG